MKTKLMLSLAMICMIGAAFADGPTFELVTDADARVEGNDPNSNFGGAGGLNVSTSGANGGNKSYIRFNATGFYSITDVKSISVYYTGNLSRNFNFYIIRQANGIDTWLENEITFNNAPANQQSDPLNPTDRQFNPNEGGGESIIFLGQLNSNTNGGLERWRTLEFDEAARAALLDALTNASEDYIVTIGLESDGGSDHALGFDSRDNASGNAPYLVIEGIIDPLLPINYEPENRAKTGITPALMWDQADEAVGLGITYEVYLGTEPNAMEANYGFDLLCTKSGDGPFSCPAGTPLDPLLYNTDYYWLINTTIPGDPDPVVVEGSLLKFTTGGPIPEIQTQPVRQTVAAGSTVQFSVSAISATSYYWFRNGTPVPLDEGKYSGSGTNTLTVTDVQTTEEGLYHCVVSNDDGAVNSAPVWLITHRLVGWWKLDDSDPNDSIRDLYPTVAQFGGQSIGEPNYVVDGKNGEAIEFYGTKPNDLVDMHGSRDFYNFYSTGFTVSAWMKAPPANAWRAFVSKNYCWGGGKAQWFYGYNLMHTNTGQATFVLRRTVEGGPGNFYSGVAVCDNNWHLVTGTWDPSDMKVRVYVDGILRTTSTAQNQLPTVKTNPAVQPGYNIYDVRIGADNDIRLNEFGINSPFIGLVDDVRIYSYPLNDREVAFLHNSFEICEAIPDFDVTGPAGVPDCEVDIYDLAEFAAAWLSPYKMGDFADIASEWLDCGLFDQGLCNN